MRQVRKPTRPVRIGASHPVAAVGGRRGDRVASTAKKQAGLEADPEAFYLTDPYRAYPWVLMRLSSVRHGAALELLEQAWRRAAPARVVAAYSPASGRA